MGLKRGQKTTYEKSYFQGANSADPSIFLKIPSKKNSRNLKRTKYKRKK